MQRANAALDSLTPEKMSYLDPGEAYVWSSKATDDSFTMGAMKKGVAPELPNTVGAQKQQSSRNHQHNLYYDAPDDASTNGQQ